MVWEKTMDIFSAISARLELPMQTCIGAMGSKEGDIVVCGACIENGEGVELLGSHGAQFLVSHAKPELAGSGVALNEVRDRVATNLADEENATALEPRPDLAQDAVSEPPRPMEMDKSEATPDLPPEDPFEDNDGEDSALIPKAEEETEAIKRSKSDDLVDVASGFAAMRSEERSSSDIDELSQDLDDVEPESVDDEIKKAVVSAQEDETEGQTEDEIVDDDSGKNDDDEYEEDDIGRFRL